MRTSSSSVRVRSAPSPGFGPVPIEAQKQVPAGVEQVTAIRKASIAPGRVVRVDRPPAEQDGVVDA